MRADDGVGGWSSGDGLSPKIAEFVAPRPRPDLGEAVVSGTKAGAAGSVVAWLLLGWLYVSNGGDAAIPVRLLAREVFGDAYFTGYGERIVLGVAAWIAAGAGFGAVFGLIMSRLIGRVGVAGAVGVGATYGVLLWIVTVFVVVAHLSPEFLMLYDQQALLCAFALYGGCLGLMGRPYRAATRSRP